MRVKAASAILRNREMKKKRAKAWIGMAFMEWGCEQSMIDTGTSIARRSLLLT